MSDLVSGDLVRRQCSELVREAVEQERERIRQRIEAALAAAEASAKGASGTPEEVARHRTITEWMVSEIRRALGGSDE